MSIEIKSIKGYYYLDAWVMSHIIHQATISFCQRYLNKTNGELKSIQDIEVAKSKDLINETKHAFDDNPDNHARILIRNYDAVWDKNLDGFEMFMDYVGKYSEIAENPLDDFVDIHREYLCTDEKGALSQLSHEGRPLGEVMYEDILNELKVEFPENFK